MSKVFSKGCLLGNLFCFPMVYNISIKDGAPIATGKNTDLSLSGDGLFMVRRGNENYYTRNGNFEFDMEGNYVLSGSGHIVQGWMVKDGVLDTTTATEDIKIKKGQPLVAVEDVTLTGIVTVQSYL